MLAAVDNGYLLTGDPNHVYELQYYDKNGAPLWGQATYFSVYSLNDFPGNTDYLYGIQVLTADGYGYMGLDGKAIIPPQYEALDLLLPDGCFSARQRAPECFWICSPALSLQKLV